MDIPQEFINFTIWFHQDMLLIHSSISEIVATALEDVRPENIRKLEKFMSSCIASCDDEDLMKIWNNSKTDWHINSPKGAKEFWQRLLDEIVIL
jgi:hypothetical protein